MRPRLKHTNLAQKEGKKSLEKTEGTEWEYRRRITACKCESMFETEADNF